MQPNIATKKSPMALLRVLKRRKLFLLLPVLVLLPAISFYALRMTPRFRARALVGAEAAVTGRLPFTRPDTAVLTAQDQLRAVRETLLGTPMLERVIREFRLYDLSPDRANATAIEAMRARIQIQVEGPESFYVGFEGSTPEQAMQVANRMAGLFIERKSDLRGQRVEQEDIFLDAEVARLREQLQEQDDKLKGYKLSGAPALPERLTANLKQIETLQQQIQGKTDQITEGEARRAALADEVKALESQGILDVEPPSKTTAEVSLDQLRLKLNELKAKYTPEHPEIGRLQKEIQDLEAVRTPAPVLRRQPSAAQVRYMGLQAELRSIGPRLESYRREREALRTEMQMYDRRINASPGVETAVVERMRDAALTRARYETLYAKQQETKLSHRAEKTSDGFAYRIIEPAHAPTAPHSQPPTRIILAGLLGSLGIGLLAAFLAERFNPSFETAEELERFVNLPVLSSVPGIPGGRRTSPRGSQPRVADLSTAEQRRLYQDQRLATLTDPQSVAAQQYAILALKIQQWMAETGGKVLMITSGSGAEGKSLTALNLSLALAAATEGRVLLVDGDLRLPRVHERLGLNGEQGFSNLLAPDSGDTAPYISKVGALHVLPGGSNRTNPVGLLASARAREILTRLRNEYQLVVLDSPPIVPIADSHILAGLCDGVVLVVRARQTRPELLRRSIESLGAARLIGVVLNDVELAATPYAYAYRYYQRHYLGRS
jgi:polysaccharide chain length determinant protein (PEP-CTERM system associated)